MNLQHYYFDVTEKDIALVSDTPWLNPIKGHKAIVANINGKEKVVSVAKKSYKLVKNQDLIEPFLEQVSKLGVRWKIDPSHSFCQLNRMRLQVTFPDILLKDEESDIPITLYLSNSYDRSEGIRILFGFLRLVCSNGMVLGNLLGSIYARHTKGFCFENFYEEFGNASDKIQSVQNHIQLLQNRPAEEELMEQLQQSLGVRRMEEIVATDRLPDMSQWELLNDITYFISHCEEKPQRARLQLATSKVFGL